MRGQRGTTVAMALLICVGLWGCSGEQGTPPNGPSSTSFAPAKKLEASLQSRWTDCGNETTDQCAVNINVAGQSCLIEALKQCTAARFISDVPTKEGDRIVRYFYVVPGASGGCELVMLADRSGDQFSGGRSVTAVSCTDVAPADPNSCAAMMFDGECSSYPLE